MRLPMFTNLALATLLTAAALPAMAQDMEMWERSGGNSRHGRRAGRRLERAEPRPQDQPHLHPPRRDGAEDRPGDGQRRGARPDGHGPDLRAAVRGGGAARGHHRPDRRRPDARDREPRPHGGLDLRGAALRRAALRRRLGAVLEQGPVPPGRARPGEAADQPRRDPRIRRQDHRARRRREGLLPAGLLRRLQHLHRRPADVGERRHHRAQGRRTASRCRARASSRCCNGRAT